MTFNLQQHPTASGGPLGEQIARLAPWFHNLHFPSGEQTAPNHPLGDFPRFKWEQIRDHLPRDMSGMSALDIGCNAGYYSIQLAARGAAVIGIDHDEHYLMQARWAARELGVHERIEYRVMTVYDLARPPADTGLPRSFDIVIFMGVLYHLRYPLLGLDLAASRTRPGGIMIFQTLTTPDDEVAQTPEDLPITARERLIEPGWPRMSFVERELASDPTNWWVPNAACCEAMLRVAGLRVLSRPGHEIYACERAGVAGGMDAGREAWREELGEAFW